MHKTEEGKPEGLRTDGAAQNSSDAKGVRIPLAVAVSAAAIALMALCIALVPVHTSHTPPMDGIQSIEEEQRHVHDWVSQYETVSHDAVTHEEVIQPVYEHVIAHHSVCNDCQEIIDGHAQEHIDATGHSGYSTNVPVEETELVSEGRIDTITDSPAYEELVETGRACAICGMRQ